MTDVDSKVVNEITQHMNRRIETAVKAKLGKIAGQLDAMGAPGPGGDVLHRLQRLAANIAATKLDPDIRRSITARLCEANVPNRMGGENNDPDVEIYHRVVALIEQRDRAMRHAKPVTGMEVQAMCELDKANVPHMEGDTLCSRVRRLVAQRDEARGQKVKLDNFKITLDDGMVSEAIRKAIEARMDAEGVKTIRAGTGTQCEVRVRDPEGGEAWFYGDHVDVENYPGGTRLDIKRPAWLG